MDQPLAKFTLCGWQRGMKLSANPNVDLELSLEEIEAPCWHNDGFPNRLKSIVRTVRMIIAALENDEWKPPSTAREDGAAHKTTVAKDLSSAEASLGRLCAGL
jgi:hypothetical protein